MSTDGKLLAIVSMATTGMEVAAYFHNKAQSVTCVGNGEPYQKVFGPAVGKALRKVPFATETHSSSISQTPKGQPNL